MFKFLKGYFEDSAEKKRKQSHELQVRQALAEKVSRYNASCIEDDADYTEITLQGRKVRVAAEHITLKGSSGD